MSLHRLIYTSSRKNNCTEADIKQILLVSREDNAKRNVTGILLHSDKRFLQYLEGDKSTLEGLYNHIKKDDRHGGAMIRDFSPIANRSFGQWQMGFKDLSDESIQYNTDTTAEDKKTLNDLLDESTSMEDSKLRILQRFFKID